MKYFIIEIQKPNKFVESYRDYFLQKINNSDFEVVKVCQTQQEAEKESITFIRKNIVAQSGLHYEIIMGDGSEGFKGLKKTIEEFYEKLQRTI